MSTGALLEAMLEAVLAAKSQGSQKILVLSNSKSLMQTYRRNTAIDWLDSTRLFDLRFLIQNSIVCDVFLVPTVIVKDLRVVACLATRDGNFYPIRGYPVRPDPNGPDFTRSD